MKWCKNKGIFILNSDFRDDEDRSYIFMGDLKTIIDYAIINGKARPEKHSRLKK